MKAVFRRETGRLLGGFAGWAIIAVVLAAFSLASIVALRSGEAVRPAEVVRRASMAFFLIAPICAANGFCRERSDGMDRLLRALPIGAGAITLGKYCALCAPFLCGCALASLHGVVLKVFGGGAVGPFFAALGLYACAGLGVIALGLWVSAWTPSALGNALIAAALLALMFFAGRLAALVLATRYAVPAALILIGLVLLVVGCAALRDLGWALVLALVGELIALLLLSGSKAASFWNGAAALLGAFSRFEAPVQGVFDLGGLVYFLLMAAVCLVCTAQAWRLGALRARRSAA